MGEQVLAKIDRASMSNSLEVRVPFLDHEICEFIFQLNSNVYYRKDETKHLLYA
jgi:asparagine synthase (glutamine-hydrolysing)